MVLLCLIGMGGLGMQDVFMCVWLCLSEYACLLSPRYFGTLIRMAFPATENFVKIECLLAGCWSLMVRDQHVVPGKIPPRAGEFSAWFPFQGCLCPGLKWCCSSKQSGCVLAHVAEVQPLVTSGQYIRGGRAHGLPTTSGVYLNPSPRTLSQGQPLDRSFLGCRTP